MSSKNFHFTLVYAQPEAYRFSHDSVFLARQIFETFAHQDLANMVGLDLCSGCGVVGLDFLFHCADQASSVPKHFDFVEVQGLYRPYFETNAELLRQAPLATRLTTSLQFLEKNYAALLSEEFRGRYNLVLCNPPYFRPEHGKLSPSEFKNRCRFFLDSDFKTLVQALAHVLASGGQAFVLLRDLSAHGFDAFAEAQEFLPDSVRIHKWGQIRGTDVVCLTAL